MPLDNAELEQLLQGSAPAHHDVGVVAGGPSHLQGEISEHDGAGADHLNDDRLRQGYKNDVVEIEVSILRLRLGPCRERSENLVAVQDHQVIRGRTGTATVPAARCRNRRRGSFMHFLD